MAVVHHALRWQMSEPACAAAAQAAELAKACDPAGLARLGEDFARRAAGSPALEALELGDPDYVRSWLSPEAVHPALVTLLAWAPGFVLLDEADAHLLAGLYREGGSPARPPAATGRHFRTLARRLEAMFGRSGFGAKPSAGQVGMWARPCPLEQALRRSGETYAADRIAALAGPDPRRSWLVSTTIW